VPPDDLAELLPGFTPENDLERAVTRDPDLLEGLAWGEPRYGHPEGAVARHVSALLDQIERRGETGERRTRLRFAALVHDSMKYKVRDWLPRTAENHHAMRARRFAERYTDDERLLSTIELHDRPYAIWRRMRRKGRLDDRAFEDMMARITDPELFLAFVEIDGSTEGKNPEPIRWFREQLRERGAVAA
jgi:HD domain